MANRQAPTGPLTALPETETWPSHVTALIYLLGDEQRSERGAKPQQSSGTLIPKLFQTSTCHQSTGFLRDQPLSPSLLCLGGGRERKAQSLSQGVCQAFSAKQPLGLIQDKTTLTGFQPLAGLVYTHTHTHTHSTVRPKDKEFFWSPWPQVS